MARKTPTKPRPKAVKEQEDERGSTRDIWKGSIAFGLVEIPIALVSAEKPGGLHLSYLDRRDFSPVGYRRYNKSNEKEVPWSEIVRGYEHADGEYVVLSKEDLKRANPALTQTISIVEFVDASEIELIYFEKPYYLEPLKAKSRSYALLRETLRRTKKVGVARVAIRTKEHVAVVGVREQALVLYLLRYATEIRSSSTLDNVSGEGGPEVSAKEIQMAERLVADMSGDWDPEAYKDEYVDDVMKVVEEKVRSGAVHVLDEKADPRAKKPRAEVLDLMPLLRQSVEAAKAKTSRKEAAPKTPKKGTRRSGSQELSKRSA